MAEAAELAVVVPRVASTAAAAVAPSSSEPEQDRRRDDGGAVQQLLELPAPRERRLHRLYSSSGVVERGLFCQCCAPCCALTTRRVVLLWIIGFAAFWLILSVAIFAVEQSASSDTSASVVTNFALSLLLVLLQVLLLGYVVLRITRPLFRLEKMMLAAVQRTGSAKAPDSSLLHELPEIRRIYEAQMQLVAELERARAELIAAQDHAACLAGELTALRAEIRTFYDTGAAVAGPCGGGSGGGGPAGATLAQPPPTLRPAVEQLRETAGHADGAAATDDEQQPPQQPHQPHQPEITASLPSVPPSRLWSAAARRPLYVWIGTWNVGNNPPPASLATWLSSTGRADIVAVGLQECAYLTALRAPHIEEHFVQLLERTLGPSYYLVNAQSILRDRNGAEANDLGGSGGGGGDGGGGSGGGVSMPTLHVPSQLRDTAGIRLFIFALRQCRRFVELLDASHVRAGLARLGYNKGCVSSVLRVYGRTMCFANAHLVRRRACDRGDRRDRWDRRDRAMVVQGRGSIVAVVRAGGTAHRGGPRMRAGRARAVRQEPQRGLRAHRAEGQIRPQLGRWAAMWQRAPHLPRTRACMRGRIG